MSEVTDSATTEPARWHHVIAAKFTDRVVGTVDWDVPTPVAEWSARDIVGHLVGWFPGFLAAGCELTLPDGPDVADDPAGAWRTQTKAVQAILDNAATAGLPYRSSRFGDLTVAEAINQFYTSDVFMHTWDLARATGQPDRLDAQTCAEMLAGMLDAEAMIRDSGQFGDQQPVREGSDATDRLIAFIGRDPYWTPPVRPTTP